MVRNPESKTVLDSFTWGENAKAVCPLSYVEILLRAKKELHFGDCKESILKD